MGDRWQRIPKQGIEIAGSCARQYCGQSWARWSFNCQGRAPVPEAYVRPAGPGRPVDKRVYLPKVGSDQLFRGDAVRFRRLSGA